eukprot:Skav208537  [mRNA]  locus=scaffold1216:179219:184084:- [translate_table: standard]
MFLVRISTSHQAVTAILGSKMECNQDIDQLQICWHVFVQRLFQPLYQHGFQLLVVSFLSVLTFLCWQHFIAERTREGARTALILNLCVLLAIPVWLLCLWLPLWWGNFVAVLFQLSLELLVIYSLGIFVSRINFEGCRRTTLPYTWLFLCFALTPFVLIFASTWKIRDHLSDSVRQGWEPPQAPCDDLASLPRDPADKLSIFAPPVDASVWVLYRLLLQAGVNSKDYYETSQARKRLSPAQKYLFSVHVMNAGCMGGSFLMLASLYENVSFVAVTEMRADFFLGIFILVGLVRTLQLNGFYDHLTVVSLGTLFWTLHWIMKENVKRELGWRYDHSFLGLSEFDIRHQFLSICGTCACVAAWFLHFCRTPECQLHGLTALKPREPHVDQWVLMGCPEHPKNWRGKFYFEVEFTGDPSSVCRAQVGWLDFDEELDGPPSAVGLPTCVLDGSGLVVGHNELQSSRDDMFEWKGGDIAGFAMDLSTGTFSCFSRHGTSSGTTRRGRALHLGYPAVYTFGSFFRLHLAESEWRLQAPEGYQEWGRGDYAFVSNLISELEASDASESSDTKSGCGLQCI